jgi:hypothetical protein
MNGTATPEQRGDLSRDELMSALFANMVVQQTNMALVFWAKAAQRPTSLSRTWTPPRCSSTSWK